jgi:hypothetical protein
MTGKAVYDWGNDRHARVMRARRYIQKKFWVKIRKFIAWWSIWSAVIIWAMYSIK